MAKRTRKQPAPTPVETEVQPLDTVEEETAPEAEQLAVEETVEESVPEVTETKKKSRRTRKNRKQKEAEEPTEAEGSEKEDGEEADDLTEADPYAPYRYRWEATHRDTRKFDFRRFLMTLVTVIFALGTVALAILTFLHFTAPPATQAPQEEEKKPTSSIVLESVAPKDVEDALTVQEMIKKVKPSVVGIEVTKNDNTSGVATGLIVHKDGYILTNRHVIQDSKEIVVHVSNKQTYPGSVIGTDELSDIAVVRIHNAEGLKAAKLGDSSLVRQGDWVVALGTPGSLEFSASATLGIVSGTDRRVQMKGEGDVSKTFTVIQTDASINPGNSGGPLVNVYGQVIGINSMKLSNDSYESIGFALPINGVISIANQIIEGGRVEERPEEDFVVGGTVLGANLEYFSPYDAQEAGLTPGAYVLTVDQDGPAELAGLRRGDIVTVFDEKPVTSLAVITETLAEKKAGDKITLEILRGRETKTIKVSLAAYVGEAA
ncbi:MAG: trypsin-like peptidase domain-containing protein [Clostridia bacterium]|nr:trypsin-like peptidase domain-containing protein [Clostridia bacterium]